MLDFHMEREHGKRQADALLLNRKGMEHHMINGHFMTVISNRKSFDIVTLVTLVVFYQNCIS